ncbi:MAG TPA: choice-of-anchor Q domain-containing protein [Nitrolancea sp.]|nr:choice-of-anchor Q domain-containing protein [Nitrolancea sp.]
MVSWATLRQANRTRIMLIVAMLVLVCGPVVAAPSGALAADCAIGDISAAINSANSSAPSSVMFTLTAGCTYTYTGPGTYNDSDSQPSALPELTGHLILHGNNAVIIRDSAAPAARIFSIGATGNLELDNVTIRGGTSPSNGGGGIANQGGMLTLTNSQVVDNFAVGGFGGGIVSTGTTEIQNSTISSNTASFGGGLANLGGSMTIDSSTIYDNGSDFGPAGIYNVPTNVAATLNLVNSTVVGNTGTGGIGILNLSTFTAYNSTIALNSTQGINNQGGTQDLPSTSTLVNTIVANNVGVDCDASLTHFGGVVDNGYNLDSDGTCGLSAGNHSLPSTNPQFSNVGLSFQGGLTQVLPLSTASPALDAGNDAVCTTAPVNSLDQRGVVRPQGAHCDIGAYEVIAPTITPASATAQDVDTTVALSATATTACGATGTYCPVIDAGTVTFTVTDNQQNVVGVPVSGTVSVGSAMALFSLPTLAPGSYTITASYHDAAGVYGDSVGTSTLTITPGPPATLTLAPGDTGAAVGQSVTEVATVKDANGNLVADGTIVNFSVTGSNSTSGSAGTHNGQASFSYGAIVTGTDTLTATAVGGSTPSATATITWTPPVSTHHASLTIMSPFTPMMQAAVLTGANGGTPSGTLSYSSAAVKLSQVHLAALVASGSNATVFGTARLADGTTVDFRLDVTAARFGGTVRLRLSNGYDSGNVHVLAVRVSP